MRPLSWYPPVEPSSFEQTIITRIKRANLFVFLRHHRHEFFDDAFQEELAILYAPSLRGQPPIPPAQLALATIVQAYTGVSDDEVIEATLMDRRWQLVLDCLDIEQAPFSKGTFVAFRKRLIDTQMDRRLIERTIEIASQSQEFGSRALRAALDSSPYGEPDEWKKRTISWVTRSKKYCAWWPISKGGSEKKLRKGQEQN
jgi:hypothetical protein